MTCPVHAPGALPEAWYRVWQGNIDSRWWSPDLPAPRPNEASYVGYLIHRFLRHIPEFSGAPLQSFLGFTGEQDRFGHDFGRSWGTFGMFRIEGGCSADVSRPPDAPPRPAPGVRTGFPPAPLTGRRECDAFNGWRLLEIGDGGDNMPIYDRMLRDLMPSVSPPTPDVDASVQRRLATVPTGVWWPDPWEYWRDPSSTPSYVAMGLLNLRRHLLAALAEANRILARTAPALGALDLLNGDIFTIAMAHMAYSAGAPRTGQRVASFYRVWSSAESSSIPSAREHARRARWSAYLRDLVRRVGTGAAALPFVTDSHGSRHGTHANETHTAISALQQVRGGYYADIGERRRRRQGPTSLTSWFGLGIPEEEDIHCVLANGSIGHRTRLSPLPSLTLWVTPI